MTTPADLDTERHEDRTGDGRFAGRRGRAFLRAAYHRPGTGRRDRPACDPTQCAAGGTADKRGINPRTARFWRTVRPADRPTAAYGPATFRTARHSGLDEPRGTLHATRRLGARRAARRLLRPAPLPAL